MNPERICYGCFLEKEPGSVCRHCGFDEREEQPFLALPLGTLLNGRYMIGKVLGIGGFGITYLGYDLTLEIKVAVKEYMPSGLATRHSDGYKVAMTGRVEQEYQSGMERFLDEARILAKLQNTPHIVSVQNYFKENGTAYFVMEYIEGMSLKAYLDQQGGRLPYGQALTILLPVMEALAQVHGLNLLHRDISPDNIYITSQGESRLLDFGAARFAMGDGKSVSVILKHGYAPEEQYRSHGNQGPWTDVYAMGATLYRCVTGQLPPDSIERMHGDNLKRPSELGVRLPGNVENAIVKALAVRTEDRFSNMSAFIDALTNRVSVKDRVAASVSQRTQAAGFAPAAAPEKKPKANGGFVGFLKANPVVAWAIGGCCLLVMALCIILPLALSGGRNSQQAVGGGGSVGSPQQSGPLIEQPAQTITVSPTEAPGLNQPAETLEPSTGSQTMDLGILNATIDVPSHYTETGSGLIEFFDAATSRGIQLDFVWSMGLPIYSVDDFADNLYSMLDICVEYYVNDAPYTLTGNSACQVDGKNAYRAEIEATATSGTSMKLTLTAVDSNNGFGCYLLLTACPSGDAEGQAELDGIVGSFASKGPVSANYDMTASSLAGLKFITDQTMSQGGIFESELTDDGGNAYYSVNLYPTQESREAAWNPNSEQAGGVEVMDVSNYFAEPDDAISAIEESLVDNGNPLDVVASNLYTESYGGVEWLFQDYTLLSYTYSAAAAKINGRCYMVMIMCNDENRNVVVSLWQQVLSSLRPY